MQDYTYFNTRSIKQILTKMDLEEPLDCGLPGNGVLHLDPSLPFLWVYRLTNFEADNGMLRLLKSGASYIIIGNQEFELYQELLKNISDKLSSKFNSYLLLELYLGSESSSSFIIKGPLEKIPSTLNIFQEELENIKSPAFGLKLGATIKNTKSRQNEDVTPLLDLAEAKSVGALIIGLEIPPVFQGINNEIYPVYFRQFRDQLTKAIQKGVYDFIRVQTSSGFSSYNALGKRKLDEEVFKIDKQLTEIEATYQYLLLVAPVNIQQLRKVFFESNFEELPKYHYRLLPIDPDLLKRKLYELPIGEINDPALSFIFSEKREELDQQITMLNERGSRNFFFNSIRLYKEVPPEVEYEAEEILRNIPETTSYDESNLIDAKDFSALARKEFEYFQSQDPNFKSKVHIRDDVNVMMVSQGELYIPSDYKVDYTEATALIQHEIGTHVLTSYNGKMQPLSQLSAGLADYDPLQEGLAVLSEYLIGGLTGNRLRILAGRVVAGVALYNGGDFREIFDLLYKKHNFSKERAFNITSRFLQGGGFMKDIIYLKGLVQLTEYIKKGEDLEILFAGKFALKHLNVIKELMEREILIPPVLKPRYLSLEDYQTKLNKIREGMPLSQMKKS